MRTIGLALLIIALVIAAAALVVGSRQTRVPPPFGLAANGLIAYASAGDIYVLDPGDGHVARHRHRAGRSTPSPVFSPDGTRIAFRRAADMTAGSPPRTSSSSLPTARIRPSSPRADPGWARALRVGAGLPLDPRHGRPSSTRRSGCSTRPPPQPPRTIATNAFALDRPFQPPDGTVDPHRPGHRDPARQMFVLDLATAKETRLFGGGTAATTSARRAGHRTGSRSSTTTRRPTIRTSQRLFIVNADGTGGHQITSAPGVWLRHRCGLVAGRVPDRLHPLPAASARIWLVRPIGIYSLATGKVTDARAAAPRVRAPRHPTRQIDSRRPARALPSNGRRTAQSLIAVPERGDSGTRS